MDLMLSLSQCCGLEGGLAQQSAAGGRVGGGMGWTVDEKRGVAQSSTDMQGHQPKVDYSFKFAWKVTLFMLSSKSITHRNNQSQI